MKKITFSKLSGSGNDFICIDNTAGQYDTMLADLSKVGCFVRTLCHRGLAVGADGVIFAVKTEIPERSDISARFFEADGSEAELCGNGTACFVRFLIERGICPDKEIRIITPAGIVLGRRTDDDYVLVCIPLPHDIQQDIKLEIDDRTWNFDFAIAGVPHVISYVEDAESVDINKWGPKIRFHPSFGPRGVNANFVQVLGEGSLFLRTWEFGVEGETLACGTGSAAAATLAAMRFGWNRRFTTSAEPIRVKARSGDTLRIWLTIQDDGKISDLCLETLVRSINTGTLSPQLANAATTFDH